MSIDTDVHWLRIQLTKADAFYSSPRTHDTLKRALGEVWDKAVALYDDKTDATIFLTTKNRFLGDKSPLDAALQGESHFEMVSNYLRQIEAGVHI